jgi:hypothetical protein
VDSPPDRPLFGFALQAQNVRKLLIVIGLATNSEDPLLSPVLLAKFADFGQNSTDFGQTRIWPL